MGGASSRSLQAQEDRRSNRQSHGSAADNARWTFVRGTPPTELLRLPTSAPKKFSVRSATVQHDASMATNVYPCFRGGLLFRIIDPRDGGWHFYNDTSDMEMYVEYHFGPNSRLDVPPYVTIEPSCLPGTEGWMCASMTIFPGETMLFVRGTSSVNGFRSVYRIAPLSDQVAQRQVQELEQVTETLSGEVIVVQKLTAELMEHPEVIEHGGFEELIIDRCARQKIPFVDLQFPPSAESLFGTRASGAAAVAAVGRGVPAGGFAGGGMMDSSMMAATGFGASGLNNFGATFSDTLAAGAANSGRGGGAAAVVAAAAVAAAAAGAADDDEYDGDARDLHRRLPPVVWMRPKQFLTEEEAAEVAILSRGVEVHDIDCGFLGDTWLLSAISGVAERPEVIEWIFRDSNMKKGARRSVITMSAAVAAASAAASNNSSGSNVFASPGSSGGDLFSASTSPSVPSPYLTSGRSALAVGACRVCLNVNGWWTSVVLDDYLPCIGKRPAFAANRRDKRELWPPILEKAFAKIYGSYAALSGGDPLLAWRTLTGFPTRRFDQEWQSAVKHESGEEIFDFLLQNHSNGFLIGLNTRGVDATFSHDLSDVNQLQCQETIARYEAIGLQMGYSYALLDVQYFENLKLFLLKLRNPWSIGNEWNGCWSDRSEMWNRFPDVKAVCKPEVKADGVFWMAWEDARQYFDGGGLCFWRPLSTLFDHRVMGQFVDSHCSVCLELYVKEPTRLTFTLSQEDNTSSGCFPQHPHQQQQQQQVQQGVGQKSNDSSGVLAAMMLSIAVPVEDTAATTSKSGDNSPVVQSLYKVQWNSTTDPQTPSDDFTFTFARDLGIILDLEPSTKPYLVLPRVFDAGVQKHYVMGILSDKHRAGAPDSPFDVKFVEVREDSAFFVNHRLVQHPKGISRGTRAHFQVKTAAGVAEGTDSRFALPTPSSRRGTAGSSVAAATAAAAAASSSGSDHDGTSG